MSILVKQQHRIKRIKSIKKKFIRNGMLHPRVVVFRSNKHIYAQIINDLEGKTIVSASDKGLDTKTKPTDVAFEVGKALGLKAIESSLSKVIFDRRGYKYHGRVKALVDGIRETGLIF